MLNRRYLRIKVMQSLYSFFQSDNKELNKSEQQLFKSINQIYDLYTYLLLLLIEIRDHAENVMTDARSKRLPTYQDLNPSSRFIDNKFLRQVQANERLQREASARKVSWQNEPELVKKIFNAIRTGEEYAAYLSSEDNSYSSHKAFIEEIYKNYIADYELLHSFFEEKNIYWADDIDFVNSMVIKTISLSNEDKISLMSLYKDEPEDKQFIADLFRKTILFQAETEKYIADKTKNWEVERIAMMDVLLMKMAITEILHFSNIPIKVSLNEYIEISKMYSTPKSKIFINGILDKLVADFKTDDKIKKVGRGLLE